MAVPKSKKSKSKTRMHRSHHALNWVNWGICSKTGELTRSHRVSLGGYYKGLLVEKLAKKTKE